MEAREFLNQYRNAYRERRVKLDAIKELEERIVMVRSMDYAADRVQSSPRGDAIPEAVAALVDAQNDFIRAEKEAAENQQEVVRIIEQLADPKEREALHWRYIMCKRCEDIAGKMFISERQLYRLLALGEIHVDAILNPRNPEEDNAVAADNVSECQY